MYDFSITTHFAQRHVPILPDEIARDLENLSEGDDTRCVRLAKLEKWRKGEEDVFPADAEADVFEEQIKSVVLPESKESSVEGIYTGCVN